MDILQHHQQQQVGLNKADEKTHKPKSRKTYQHNTRPLASKFGTDDHDVTRDGARNPSNRAKKYTPKNIERVSDREQIDPKPKLPNGTKTTTETPRSATKRRKPRIPTSPWILVTDIPPMSKLSDLIPSLSSILDFEMKKGIIDLDQLFNENGEFRDPEVYKRLQEMNAHQSLYSTQTIKPSDNIPLLQLPIDTNGNLSGQNLITEARLHLSYRARPTGWFLRLPSASISHAIQSHIRQAGIHEKSIQEQFNHESNEVREKRKVWTEGLWRRVYNDVVMERFARRNDEESLAMMGEDKMDGGNMDGEIGNSGVHEDVADEKLMWGEDTTTHLSDRSSRAGVDAFFDEYAQSRPYPMHSTSMPSVESVFGYHRLKCGSTPLRIQEFSPKPMSRDETKQHSPLWEQKSFHLGDLLDLSDSVVRVETYALKMSLDDVKYLFRGYDLKSIRPEDEEEKETPLPSWCANLAQTIGWNVIGAHSPQLAVHLLLEGKRRTENNRQDNGNRVVIPSYNTFLVRFATAADARMAVRDKQCNIFQDRRLILSQYPSAQLA